MFAFTNNSARGQGFQCRKSMIFALLVLEYNLRSPGVLPRFLSSVADALLQGEEVKSE